MKPKGCLFFLVTICGNHPYPIGFDWRSVHHMRPIGRTWGDRVGAAKKDAGSNGWAKFWWIFKGFLGPLWYFSRVSYAFVENTFSRLPSLRPSLAISLFFFPQKAKGKRLSYEGNGMMLVLLKNLTLGWSSFDLLEGHGQGQSRYPGGHPKTP